MQALGAEEARKRLPELLHSAYQGDSTLIKKRGKPYARIVPVDRPANSASLLTLQGSGKGLWGEAATETIRDYRNEWA